MLVTAVGIQASPWPAGSCITAASEVRNTAMDRSANPRYHAEDALVAELELLNTLTNSCTGSWAAKELVKQVEQF